MNPDDQKHVSNSKSQELRSPASLQNIAMQRYSLFFKHARDIIKFLDKGGRILDANNAAVDAYQYSREELLSKSIFDLRSPESSPMTIEQVLQAGESGLLFDAIHVRKDGSTFPVEVSARAVEIEGQILIMNIVRDVSQRREAEEELRDSEERYRQLFEWNPLPMWVYDRDSLRFLAVNDAAIRTYGYSKPEFLSMSIKELSIPAELPAMLKNVARKRSGLESIGVWRHVKKDGSMIYASLSTYDLPFAKSNARLVLADDITEKQRSAEALLDAEAKYRSLVEESFFGVYIIQDGRFRYVNPRLAEIYGFTQEEMIRIPGMDLVAPEYKELVAENLRKRIEGGLKSAHYSYKAIRKDGRLIDVEVFGSRTMYHGEPAVIGSLLDITERRLAEQRERELEAQKHEFFQRTILAATEGKLVITDAAEIDRIAGPAIESWDIDRGECLSPTRKSVEEIARREGMDEEKVFDFILCVGEAATNAIKHAHGGKATLHKVEDGLLFVISDHGPGIDAVALPEVALRVGYSTAVSLGIGYKEIITLADRVYLSTGPDGTTVAIKMSLHSNVLRIPQVLLPETW